MPDFGGQNLTTTSPPPQEAAPARLDLLKMVEAFRSRLWVFLLAVAGVMLLVGFTSFTATPLYTASTQIIIDPRQKQILGDNIQAVVAGLPPDSVSVATETEIMLSRALAGRVVDTLNLVEDEEFGTNPAKGLRAQIARLFGQRPEELTAAKRALIRENAITALTRRVKVERIGVTYLINIAVTSEDSAKAVKIADTFASLYITQQLETKFDSTARAAEWLTNKLSEMSAEVEGKELKVEQYRAQAGLLTTDGVRINEQATGQINLQLANQRSELAAREARFRELQGALSRGGSAEAASEALASPVVQSYRAQLAQLERERAEMATTRGPRHPQMVQKDREIAGVKRELDQEVGRIVESMRREVQVAREQVGALEGELTGQRQNLAENNVGAVRLAQLQREADAASTLYNSFLKRQQEIAEQSGVEQPDARVQSRASLPSRPSSPNVPLNLMMGLFAGLLLGSLIVLILELLEQTLRKPEDVPATLGLPCLGAAPHLDRRTRMVDGELLSPENFVLKRPLSAFGESMRAVRAGVFFSSPDRKVKVVCVTSSLPDEGKTTTALALARISALAGSKTVVVDCDLRRRSATHGLGLDVDKGLTEVLFRSASLNDVIRKDPGSGADVVPLAQAEFTPRDLFGSDAMRSLIEALRARYDVVILDSAPVMPVSDTRMLASIADSVLMVVRWGKTPAPVVRQAIQQLRTHGARMSGVVLCGVESTLISRLLYDQPDYYGELYQTYYIR
jgi:capsular exopolysaccharide synthesis family protein